MRSVEVIRSSRLLAAFSCLALLGTARIAAQCTNNNVLTGAALNVPCPGNLTVPCVQGGQYALVNVTAGNTYTFSTCTGNSFDTQITLFDNTGGAALGYNDDACGTFGLQSSVSWPATFSGQLRVLVDQWNCASNAVCIPLTIVCSPPPPPVTNNNPCQAIALPVTNTCVTQNFSNVGANLTTAPVIPAPGCGNLIAGSADVWFTFVAPPSGIAIIESFAGSLTDGVMALYTATACAGTYNLIECSDDVQGAMPYLAYNNLVPGTTYYLRYWGYSAATGTFSLCVHGPTSVPAGSCVYLLELADGFGDGWGGSYVTVTVNGVPTVYTCNTFYNAFLIGVNIGNTVTIGYTVNGGPFQGENVYQLSFFSTGQVIFNSGSPPVAGNNVFQQTVTCDPPPAVQEDCIGGFTICGADNIDNNTNNTGSVVDLNDGNNGCLESDEQQGTWYNFAIATGGTLGLTINPTGPDDYDWAIWGPYPPGSSTSSMCAPVGDPIRCSYASGASTAFATGDYNTGMGNANVAWSNPQYAAPLPVQHDFVAGDGWTSGINVTAGQRYLMYISNFDLTGQSFDLSWQLGLGASLDCVLLPVELLTFNASVIDQQVVVQWSTASEQGSDRFLVQRRAGEAHFNTIATVNAAGNMHQVSHYSHIDTAPEQGINLYRLVSLDADGHETLSNVVPVHFASDGPSTDPFPMPVTDIVWWPIGTGIQSGHVTIQDVTGRTVGDHIITPNDRGLTRLDMAGLPDGLYHLIAWDGQGTRISSTRVLKK